MNKARRKQLEEIESRLSDIYDDLESIANEEEEYRDCMPENLQGSDRYTDSESASDYMQEALDAIDNARDAVSSATDY